MEPIIIKRRNLLCKN